MVSSQLTTLTKTSTCKPFPSNRLFPVNLSDVVLPDPVELDFSDVFGPLPADASDEVIFGDSSDLVYDGPAVIYSRSHSLVGPSAFTRQSLKLSKLTIHESEESMDFLDCLSDETSTEDSAVKEALANVDNKCLKPNSVGLEDFEVMKLVGQGAFGKVFQVRQKGTSEVYAMKVMRKDKIMEKNHAEYMKAERDSFTKIDHPFIVQLRCRFK